MTYLRELGLQQAVVIVLPEGLVELLVRADAILIHQKDRTYFFHGGAEVFGSDPASVEVPIRLPELCHQLFVRIFLIILFRFCGVVRSGTASDYNLLLGRLFVRQVDLIVFLAKVNTF